jgi:hypothetical protein
MSNNAFKSSLTILGARIESMCSAIIDELGFIGVSAAQNTNLFNNNGPLRQATQFHKADLFSGTVLADKPYAYWLENGNNQEGEYIYPKNINPRTGKVFQCLHFYVNGAEVFTKRVKTHGGYFFMKSAREEVEKRYQSVVAKHFNKIVAK